MHQLYQGPYLRNAPDLVIGYAEGYRVSWECAKGAAGEPIFTDNEKKWSGDHCVDYKIVPGVLFSNLKLQTSQVSIKDVAPTIPNYFEVPPPAYMEGKALI